MKKKTGGGGSSSELVAVAFGIVPATAAWLYFYAHAILYIFAIYFAGHKFICGCNSNSPLPGRRTQDRMVLRLLLRLQLWLMLRLRWGMAFGLK